ncbi:hypothetical protein B0T26DRAFT_755799 [Lasiosphaeria miniovina]|uniref:Uncharacterized protein n=1 Tax=Lasiosphaeria miniovina TaxID=1954250 RepID=A0AA39ZZ15_9PEZI|nr:uncharacterized protein B0T26DRAFT_755799 [Lasiosphaeria miniovina]KAK0706277.1 hypothetical protein B0T26DRAFT_755799 [Lasiosphaeria miniovina]
MQGLWTVATRALPPGGFDPGWGLPVWNILLMIWLAVAGCVPLGTRSRHWHALKPMHAGMLLLAIWFCLHVIDQLIHQRQAAVTYGYIVFPAVYNILRTLSDLLLFAGLGLGLLRCHTPDVAAAEGLGFVVAATAVLWVLGMYQVGLNLSLCFAWLGFSDVGSIDAIAAARSGFDVAYAAVYFLGVPALAIVASDEPTVPTPELAPSDSAPLASKLADVKFAFNGAAVALFLRSFCEVVIVGQLDRAPADLQTTYVARDVCYGLWSSLCMVFLLVGSPGRFDSGGGGDVDLWDEDEKAGASRREAERRRIAATCQSVEAALAAWVVDLREALAEKLDRVTYGAALTAPPVGQVLDELEADIDKAPKDRGRTSDPDFVARLSAAKHKEIGVLRERFAGWEVIDKRDNGATVPEDAADEEKDAKEPDGDVAEAVSLARAEEPAESTEPVPEMEEPYAQPARNTTFLDVLRAHRRGIRPGDV